MNQLENFTIFVKDLYKSGDMMLLLRRIDVFMEFEDSFVAHRITVEKDHNYFTAINKLKISADRILVDINTTARTICNHDECGIEIPGDNHDTLMPMVGQLRIHYRTIVKEYTDICEAIKTLYECGNCEK